MTTNWSRALLLDSAERSQQSMSHALACDHDIAFAPVAADAQHDRRSFRAADHADGALVAEASHRRAVDGEDLVARHEARIRRASAGNDIDDREPFAPRLQYGADAGQLDAGVIAGGARREPDRDAMSIRPLPFAVSRTLGTRFMPAHDP